MSVSVTCTQYSTDIRIMVMDGMDIAVRQCGL